MSNEDFLNAEFDPNNAEAILPPAIQWINGSGDPNHPDVLNTGGFELPVERFGYLLEDEHQIISVRHSGGSIVDSYLFGQLSFAVLAVGNKQWMTYRNDRRVFLPGNFQRTEEMKISSRTRIYALCQEVYNEPVILTFSGTGSRDIDQVIRQFKRQIVSSATRMAAKKNGRSQPAFPMYAFWLKIQAGKRIIFSEGGSATPPELATINFDKKSLQSLYVGQDLINQAEAELPNALAWKKREDEFAKYGSQQEQTQQGDLPPYVGTNGQPVNSQGQPEPPPAWYDEESPGDDEIPF